MTTINLGDVTDLDKNGFKGFISISALQELNCCNVPNIPGIYLVLRADNTVPEFCPENPGFHFKGRNPSVEIDTLRRKWVDDAPVLYIGKAGGSNSRTLSVRVREYMDFGLGKRSGRHWGGRYIWQMRNSCDLLVCWMETAPNILPREIESALIHNFKDLYNRLPFANLCH